MAAIAPLKSPLLMRAINYVGKKTPKLIMKHPAIAAGAVGTGIGIASTQGPAHNLESAVMQEYLGAPGAKYSSCHIMEKFAERKMVLATKIAFEKDADWKDKDKEYQWLPPDPPQAKPPYDTGPLSRGEMYGTHTRPELYKSVGKATGQGLVNEAIAGLRRLLGMGVQAVKERVADDPKRDRIVEQVVKQDPVIATAERESPGQAVQAYQTMRRFAPTLSTDPNVVTSFLRNSALSGGPMDFQTVKGLADAETSIQKAQNEGAYWRGGF